MEELIKAAKSEIPPLDYILDETWNQLKLQKSFVKNNFGKVLITFDTKATKIFKVYERKALLKLAESWLNLQKEGIKKKFEEIFAQNGWDKFIKKASQLFVEFGILVQNLEKDLGNMRKARGGKTFEKVLLRLLEFIDVKGEIPMGKEREELRRIDIAIPSIEVATKTPDRAIFLTCKRTLRERWKIEIDQKGLIAFVRDELTKSRSLQKCLGLEN